MESHNWFLINRACIVWGDPVPDLIRGLTEIPHNIFIENEIQTETFWKSISPSVLLKAVKILMNLEAFSESVSNMATRKNPVLIDVDLLWCTNRHVIHPLMHVIL